MNNIVGGVIAAGVFEETRTVSCNLGYVVVGALSDTTYTTVCQSSESWQTTTECTSKFDISYKINAFVFLKVDNKK